MALKNPDDFVYLMDRYSGKLARYIGRLTNLCEEDCEDLLQEVFIKTYENLNDFDADLKFSSWIYRITYNHVISNYRKMKNAPKVLNGEDSELFFERLKSDLDLEAELDLKLLKEKVSEVIKQLDSRYRDVIILKFLEEKDYTEISDILRKPMGTIATLLSRAKASLKELLMKNHITQGV